MACVAACAALGGIFILTRPTRSEQAVYARRIAGTMAVSLGLILALFAWGLQRIMSG